MYLLCENWNDNTYCMASDSAKLLTRHIFSTWIQQLTGSEVERDTDSPSGACTWSLSAFGMNRKMLSH